ncbi:hypothetical protein [Actinophytocola sp.]|uniref:hypothetical protein n=1 Tax=Actinophytocola sp. TaxID=1872138 RepID=UPI002D55A2F3|nr:hypothetical protein [Actinophytocola sp.]HYQ63559.1 hypothetical protein [Actinophytocola sp.]
MTAQASAKAVTGDGAVSAVPCAFRGLSIRDASAGANTVVLYDNASAASGTVIATAQLASGEDVQISVPDGVRCTAGLYLDTTGAVTGSVWVS